MLRRMTTSHLEFNSLLHELGVYSATPEASACAAVWIWSSRQLLQMSALSKLALEENKKIEHFRKINGLPSFRQKLRIMYEGTWCHLSLFTRHVLPPNQDLISRSWPAGYFITATWAAWCLWRYMPVVFLIPHHYTGPTRHHLWGIIPFKLLEAVVMSWWKPTLWIPLHAVWYSSHRQDSMRTAWGAASISQSTENESVNNFDNHLIVYQAKCWCSFSLNC